jgi:hypothetical protein
VATQNTNDAQGRAKLTLTITPTSTGANWSASVSDGNANYGGYAQSAGSWNVKVNGVTVASASGQSYDFGSGVISNPYFPRSASNSVVLSPGSYTATATFSGDGTTVGTANVSVPFTVVPSSYTISFNSNGGSSNPSPLSGSATSPITLPSPGVKSGYDFYGWEYPGGSYAGSTGSTFYPSDTLTLIAAWTPTGGGTTYSYSYNSNGGSLTPSGAGSIPSGTVINLGDPGTKSGFSFGGWYTNSGLTTYAGGIGSSYAINSNIVFYAKWNSSSSGLPTWPSPLPTLSQFIAGQPYSDAITASNMGGGTYSISAGSLPGGIVINSATGALSGTVSTASDYSFTVSAQNGSGIITQAYSGTIRGIMRVYQNSAWVKVVAKKREGEIWKPGTVRVWANGTWLYGL